MIIASERSSKNHRLPHLPQAESLSRMLSDEFGEPFAFHDAVSGERLWDSGAEDVSDEVRDAVLRCAIEHQPHVSVMDVNHYLLTIPFSNNHPSCVVGVGVLPALAHTHNERAVEQQRLQKWAASVMRRWNDRQQAASQKPAKPSNPPQQPTLVWNSLLAMDKLFRRLRIHKDPLKYRKRILDAVADLLNVQTLVWVSQDGEAPVIGGEPCLSPWDCQQLALHLAKSPHWDETGVMLGNDVTDESWSDRCPHVKNLLAITLCDHRAAGWAIAINKHAPVSGQDVRNLGMNRHTDNASPEMPATSPRATVPFRLSDAAVLTPFLSLFGLYRTASQRFQNLNELMVGLARALTASIDAKDQYTFGHSERVACVAVELGSELGLSDDELHDIYLAGLLHDIGKIGVPDAVLGKNGPLTSDEMELIKQHVTVGYKILSGLRQIDHLLPAVLYHHERFDGQGYPHGLKGEAIPMLARIIAVADSYDAMTSSRPYRAGMPPERAEQILQQGAGTQWDENVVQAFLRCRDRIRAIRQRGAGESLRSALNGVVHEKDRSETSSSVATIVSQ